MYCRSLSPVCVCVCGGRCTVGHYHLCVCVCGGRCTVGHYHLCVCVCSGRSPAFVISFLQLVVGRVSKSDLPELQRNKFLFPATARGLGVVLRTYIYYYI